jgi:pimeloyl-ACP methyl ester carboxylesterase
MREGVVTLPDGRKLGFAEYGDPNGAPIVEFHGLPGGRFYGLEEPALWHAGARSITVERPGFGLSDPHPGRVLNDWPTDVAAFADALAIERFSVLGVSAGAPYALVTGLGLPGRVAGVGLACGLGPAFDHPEYDERLPETIRALMPLARTDREATIPLVHEFLGAQRAEWLKDPDAFFENWLIGWAENDRAAFRANEQEWRGNLEATYCREGAYPEDSIIVFGPWNLDLASMQVPVRAWHGTEDRSAPIELVECVIKVTNADLVRHQGEGHYLSPTHNAEWIEWLIAAQHATS